MDHLSAHHSALRPSQKDNIHGSSGDLVSPRVIRWRRDCRERGLSSWVYGVCMGLAMSVVVAVSVVAGQDVWRCMGAH